MARSAVVVIAQAMLTLLLSTTNAFGTIPPGITPQPGPLDLGNILENEGIVEDAIQFAAGLGITEDDLDLEFDMQSIPSFFNAHLVDNGITITSIAISVDVPKARTFPAGTIATGQLTINALGGPFVYDVSATIPEPSTICLVGLGLLGSAGFCQRIHRGRY